MINLNDEKIVIIMSGWEWVIAISVGIVAIAFFILVIYLALTLVSLRKTIQDLEEKIHAFDPLFRALSGLGKVVEKRTEEFTEEIEHSCVEKHKCWTTTAIEAAEWAALGLTLFQKIKGRR